jgi:hypothetical protein
MIFNLTPIDQAAWVRVAHTPWPCLGIDLRRMARLGLHQGFDAGAVISYHENPLNGQYDCERL